MKQGGGGVEAGRGRRGETQGSERSPLFVRDADVEVSARGILHGVNRLRAERSVLLRNLGECHGAGILD